MARFYKLLEENVEHNVNGRLPVVQLTVQYRMHPDICLFPSNYVYNRSLKTNRWARRRCSAAMVRRLAAEEEQLLAEFLGLIVRSVSQRLNDFL